jgi:hypothetical protein
MADFYLTMRPATQKVSHTWRTAIQTTVKGVEKRSMLYTWPRISLFNDFILTTNQKINYLKRNLFRYADKVWGIPVWADRTILTSQAASGQAILNVGETDYRHFYEGRNCIIIQGNDFTKYEVKTIDSFTNDQIVLTANLASTWPINSFVLPLYDCRITQDQEMSSEFQNIQNFQLSATEAYETLRSFDYSVPESGADTYQDLDLFLYKFQRSVTYKYKRAYDLSQFLGLGYAATKYDPGENVLGLQTSLLRKTKQDVWNLLNFFDSKQGRLEKFWVPTWSRDIVATSAILATDTVLTIEPMQYNTYYLPDEVIGRYLYIQFPDQSYICKKITTASTSSITLDGQIGQAVSAGDLSKLLISFLILCRFDIDELEIEYLVENFGKADLSFAGLVGETL